MILVNERKLSYATLQMMAADYGIICNTKEEIDEFVEMLDCELFSYVENEVCKVNEGL